MARSRNIKPGFFTNDVLAEVPPLGRLLFAGIWTLADREGRLEDRPKKIKAQVFPYDDCDVECLLGELASRRFIQRYEADGLHLIQVTNWHKHQNPHIKESASILPAPDKHGAFPVPPPDLSPASTARNVLQPRNGPDGSDTSTGPLPEQTESRSERAPIHTDVAHLLEPEAVCKPCGGGPADSGFLIPDPPSPNPDSPQSPMPQASAAREVSATDSDRQEPPTRNNSVLTSLEAIAKRAVLHFTPNEVAGYILAHFPVQRVSLRQRAALGDTGLTVDQVNCLVQHGCTLENARKALEHFKQEHAPKNAGAWAFHCLREELPADQQIKLREATRSAQREFKERNGAEQ